MSYGKQEVAELLGFSDQKPGDSFAWGKVQSYSGGKAKVSIGSGDAVGCASLAAVSKGDRVLVLLMRGRPVVIGKVAS